MYGCMVVCMYGCMVVWLLVCRYVRMYLCIYVSMYQCIYVSKYLCIYVKLVLFILAFFREYEICPLPKRKADRDIILNTGMSERGGPGCLRSDPGHLYEIDFQTFVVRMTGSLGSFWWRVSFHRRFPIPKHPETS